MGSGQAGKAGERLFGGRDFVLNGDRLFLFGSDADPNADPVEMRADGAVRRAASAPQGAPGIRLAMPPGDGTDAIAQADGLPPMRLRANVLTCGDVTIRSDLTRHIAEALRRGKDPEPAARLLARLLAAGVAPGFLVRLPPHLYRHLFVVNRDGSVLGYTRGYARHECGPPRVFGLAQIVRSDPDARHPATVSLVRIDPARMSHPFTVPETGRTHVCAREFCRLVTFETGGSPGMLHRIHRKVVHHAEWIADADHSPEETAIEERLGVKGMPEPERETAWLEVPLFLRR